MIWTAQPTQAHLILFEDLYQPFPYRDYEKKTYVGNSTQLLKYLPVGAVLWWAVSYGLPRSLKPEDTSNEHGKPENGVVIWKGLVWESWESASVRCTCSIARWERDSVNHCMEWGERFAQEEIVWHPAHRYQSIFLSPYLFYFPWSHRFGWWLPLLTRKEKLPNTEWWHMNCNYVKIL